MIQLTPPPHRRLLISPWSGAVPAPARTAPTAAALAIRRLKSQVRTLTVELGAAELRERQRVACQLHDELGQRIVLVRLKLAQLHGAQAGQAPALLEELTALVGLVGVAARAATFELDRPAWSDGLAAALQALGADLARQAGLEVRVDAAPVTPRLDEPRLGVVCRVVRELCLNVHKHARASRVHIAAMLDEHGLCVSVEDDGAGLRRPPPARWTARRTGGFGLASAQAQLRAFGGELALDSPSGRGTRASLVLPLAPADAQAAGRTA